MKNEKGITLISLVITIIVLLILATISINAGTGTIRYSNYNKAKAEMQAMQDNVNSWYNEYANIEVKDEEITAGQTKEDILEGKQGLYIQQYGVAASEPSSCDQTLLNSTVQATGITVANYRFLSEEYLKQNLGLDASFEYLVNIQTRKVILLGGINYDNKTYYTAEDFGIINVDSVSIVDIEYDITYENVQYEIDKISADIILYNVRIIDENTQSSDVSKLDIQYKNSQSQYFLREKNYTKVSYTDNENNTYENSYKFTMTTDFSDDDQYKIVVSTTNGKTEEKTIIIETPTFTTAYGLIDVIWVDTNNNVINEPLSPETHLGGMTGIYWDGTIETEVTDSNKSNWYNYADTSLGNASNTSRWANAKNPDDGSYFVWIPRYAYRITYYADANYTQKTGYCDGRGFVNVKGELATTTNGGPLATEQAKLDDGIQTITDNRYSYIVHPAFTDDSDVVYKEDENGNKLDENGNITNTPSEYVTLKGEYDLGGWDYELSGIWVAKYEMSMEEYSDNEWSHTNTNSSTTGNIKTSETVRAISKPGVTSWRYITIGYSYTNSYNYYRTMESHLMKNSEWGAVAYLAHSKYGRNGTEVTINDNSSYYTAGSSGATALTNVLQSTTGNETGIFDLSGGAYERVAAFNNTDINNYFTTYKWRNETGLTITSNSTKYATKYSNNSEISSGTLIYRVGKIGDATKEVFNEESEKNWFNDESYILNANYPFLLRGGDCSHGITAGIFYSHNFNRTINNYGSFHIVLIP